MTFTLLFVLLLGLPTQKQIEKKIIALRPNMTHPKRKARLRSIAEVIRIYAPQAGFKTNGDINLIVAMIKKESDFSHIAGSCGEWGMLQVIPTEAHIKRLTKRYKCHKSEIGKVFFPHGKKKTYSPCRKSRAPGSRIWYSNVGRFKNGTYKPLTSKTKLFVKYSPRGALATGIFEMQFWKRKYNRYLKRKFWSIFPSWYFKKKLRGKTMDFHRRWWTSMTTKMGNRIWVSHYNWGSRLAPGRVSRWYPKMVHKFLLILEKGDKASQSESKT